MILVISRTKLHSTLPQCKGIQDSLGFWILRHGLRIPATGFQSVSVERGFSISILDFNRFLDFDSGFLELYSGFQSSGFLILLAKFSRIQDSRNKILSNSNPDSLTWSDHSVKLTIIRRAWTGSELIAHEAKGRMGYWLRGHEGERNNCFNKIQLLGQKYWD